MDKTPGEEDKMPSYELQQAAHAHPQADEHVVLSFPLIPEETPWEYGHRLAVEGFEKALREAREAEAAQGSAKAE